MLGLQKTHFFSHLQITQAHQPSANKILFTFLCVYLKQNKILFVLWNVYKCDELFSSLATDILSLMIQK